MLLSVPVNLPLICLICLGVVCVCLLLYYFGLFGRFVFRKEKKRIVAEELPPVSVIITARDESHLLIQSLPILLTQDYPNYEVVLVNDNSVDETSQLVIEFKNTYPHLHYVDLTSSISNIKGKKFPLALGIQAAKNEVVVLTDASTIPNTPYWLQHIANHFVHKTKVVVGGVSIARKSGLGNAIQRYDSVMTMLQSFSYTLAGRPVMANGRNLAYTRTLFMKNKEKFVSKPKVPYGDDDVFMNQVARKVACDVEPDSDSFVSQAGLTNARWFRQKKIAFATRSLYDAGSRFLLKSFNVLSLLFYVALAIAVVFTLHDIVLLSIALGVAVVKIGSQYLVFGKAAKKMNQGGLTPFVLLFDLLFCLMNPFMNFLSKFEIRRWK